MNRREYLKNTALFLGYAVSASTLTEIFLACKQQAQTQLSWKPVFLSNEQANTVGEIAETILPKTKTPGAKEIGVPQFIDTMVKNTLSEKDKAAFVEGIKNFEETFEKNYHKTFTAATQAEKEAFLLQLDKTSAKFPPSAWGVTLEAHPKPIPFYRKIKDLTIFGYFSSEKVAKEFLSYDPIPGTAIGCMPLNGRNVWSGD